ncbi:hypothetical protein EVAR_20604_1 [Eumeta japonica]|uniref:Uncharacterized protein n=1 Tax=Eumeta variegata TaxID=151549 RepID=A0A4C1US00_EUMVA|nr:hypothetical protein EVAR_20604_1 [Eumeta japonica]
MRHISRRAGRCVHRRRRAAGSGSPARAVRACCASRRALMCPLCRGAPAPPALRRHPPIKLYTLIDEPPIALISAAGRDLAASVPPIPPVRFSVVETSLQLIT